MPESTSSSTGALLELQDDSSRDLRLRAHNGDPSAWGHLVDRYLPQLRRWVHGKLPQPARGFVETSDLIHDAILHTTCRLESIEPRGKRALAAYLRQAVWNRIRDEHRRIARRGLPEVLAETWPDPSPTPFDLVSETEFDTRYRTALIELTPKDRELVVAHIELDYTHEQLACMTGRSRGASRMALQRALMRLAGRMRDV